MMTYLTPLQLKPEIGHIDLFGLPRNFLLIWTQKVLQAIGIVFSCQPLSLLVWLEYSMQFPRLETKFLCLEGICE